MIDLGSGDGRIAIAAAKRGARAFGVDIDPQRVEEAQENARRAGMTGQGELPPPEPFRHPYRRGHRPHHVPAAQGQPGVEAALLDELKPGTRVVSHAFSMGDWKPDGHPTVGYRQVYLWIVPAKVAGAGASRTVRTSVSLTLEQSYQYLKGSAQLAGQNGELTEGSCAGPTSR